MKYLFDLYWEAGTRTIAIVEGKSIQDAIERYIRTTLIDIELCVEMKILPFKENYKVIKMQVEEE